MQDPIAHTGIKSAGDGLHDLAEAPLRAMHLASSATDAFTTSTHLAVDVPATEQVAQAEILSHAALAILPSASELMHAATHESIAATSGTVHQLGASLLDSLASLRTTDVQAYDTMSSSVAAVIDAINETLHAEAYGTVVHGAAMLNMSAQQLAWAVQTNMSSAAAMSALTTVQEASHTSLQGVCYA